MKKILLVGTGSRKSCDRAFLEITLKLDNFYDFKIYGPREQIYNTKETCPIIYDRALSINEIIEKIKPDCVILPESSQIPRIFVHEEDNNYNKIDIPIILIEVDYYATPDKTTYIKFGNNLVIHRAPVIETVVDSVFLPLSIDRSFLCTDEQFKNRVERVLFIGAGKWTKNVAYITRQKALTTLEENGILDHTNEVPYDDYDKLIKKYLMFLSCNLGFLNKAPAKTFEAIGAGAVLLMPDFEHRKVYFGNEKTFFEYKEDCSNLMDTVDYILHNQQEAIEVAILGRNIMKDKHLHEYRIIELKNIIDAVLSGSKIPKIWGF